MQKKDLLNKIREYHQKKGYARKLMPFYASCSVPMRNFILLVDKFDNGDVKGASLKELYLFLVNVFKNPKGLCKLTQSIFVSIYVEIMGDYLKQQTLEIKLSSQRMFPLPWKTATNNKQSEPVSCLSTNKPADVIPIFIEKEILQQLEKIPELIDAKKTFHAF